VKFLVDASSDARLVGHLQRQGHDVTRIGTHYPGDLEDWEVLALARDENRVLITDDRDFGQLIISQRMQHAGVIYFRLDSTKIELRNARLNEVLLRFREQLGGFLVVTNNNVRVVPPR
jgi:predicted nuclease of predicted toxin-antitoxin system